MMKTEFSRQMKTFLHVTGHIVRKHLIVDKLVDGHKLTFSCITLHTRDKSSKCFIEETVTM